MALEVGVCLASAFPTPGAMNRAATPFYNPFYFLRPYNRDPTINRGHMLDKSAFYDAFVQMCREVRHNYAINSAPSRFGSFTRRETALAVISTAG
jgi:hypothetical protein